MALTLTDLKKLTPAPKPYKRHDSLGLFAQVAPTGRVHWRFKYTLAGRRNALSLGSWPEVSLSEARAERDRLRSFLREGKDPSEARRANRLEAAKLSGVTFGQFADEWFLRQSQGKQPTTLKAVKHRLSQTKPLRHRPLSAITSPEIRKLLDGIAAEGKHETAMRVRSLMSSIYRAAILQGLVERDPAEPAKGWQRFRTTNGLAAIVTPKEFGGLLRAIAGYDGSEVTRVALFMLSRTAMRPGELRHLRWTDVDLDRAEIRLSESRVKQKRDIIFPLSTQVVDALQKLHRLTGRSPLVFPGNGGRPLSDNTLNAALRRLGYSKDDHTAHGFRKSFSSLLSEDGGDAEVIELCLGHSVPGVRGVYLKTTRLPQRRELMQRWADLCAEYQHG